MPARFVDLDRQTPMFLPFDLHVSHRNKQAFKAAFVSVLQLAQHLRLSKVGTVCVNGASHLPRSTPAFARRATAWPLNPDGPRRSLGGDGEDEVRRAPWFTCSLGGHNHGPKNLVSMFFGIPMRRCTKSPLSRVDRLQPQLKTTIPAA
jgi:hypothetical protein